jgi:hypothetical protein
MKILSRLLTVFLGLVIVLIFAGMVWFYRCVPYHESIAQKDNTYYLDESFDRVKKILVKTDSLEEIVAHQHGQLVSRNWSNLHASSERLLKGWEINGSGEFVVRTTHPETGSMLLHFRQKVVIGSTINVISDLQEPVEYLKAYRTTLAMEPAGERTKVVSTVSLMYGRRLPLSYIAYMDKQVDQAGEQSIVRNEEAIRNLVQKYKGRNFIIPIRK